MDTIATPGFRALFATAVTWVMLVTVKPAAFFTPSGSPRLARWAVSRPEQLQESVTVPYWAVALAVGVAVDLFI